jgi:hypothetical protein
VALIESEVTEFSGLKKVTGRCTDTDFVRKVADGAAVKASTFFNAANERHMAKARFEILNMVYFLIKLNMY